VAIGTGGYVCYPVLRSAARLNIPTILHESNVQPGLTTKMLEKHLTRILLGFEASAKHFSATDKLTFTGTPVNAEFRAAQPDSGGGAGESKPLVLSFWGSLGAKYMNAQMPEFVRLNEVQEAFRHVHAAGKNFDVAEIPRSKPQLSDIRQYIYDMPQTMRSASLVICRAGSSTLCELAASGTPSILVPSPYVAANHQEPNALAFQERGAAIVITERDASAARLFGLAAELVNDPARLAQMARAAKSLDTPNATERIAESVIAAAVSRRN
jgi:UDP-N-acetylglucosamine--N-acetylmuramyl-(pentapeptide) pyrophosphoryl-undecaprenol N-acetylglucosamine transferase